MPAKSPKPRVDSPAPTQIAVGYSRQSRTRAAELAEDRNFNYSPELQNNANKSFALSRQWQWNDDLTNSAVELNTSGGTRASDKKKGNSSWRKRRGLMLLLEAAQRGEFRHLVVYKLSRLARSAREGLEIFDAFEAAGVAVHVASEGIDYSTPTGRLLRTIMLAVAEMELENIREFATAAILERVKAGKHHSNLPAWVEKVPEQERQDETDIHRLRFPYADTLRTLIRFRVAGLSYAQCARAMNEAHLPTAENGEWNADLCFHYLNPDYRLRYRGWSIFGRYLEDDDPRRILNENVWPPLMSEAELDELDAVQRTLSSQGFKDADGNNVHGPGRVPVASTWLLSGLGKCAICGGPIYPRGGSNGKKAYSCQRGASAGSHPAQETGMRNVKSRAYVAAPALEEAVLRALGVALQQHGGQMIVHAPAAETAPKKSKPKRDLGKLAEAENTLFDALTDGTITKGKFTQQLARIEQERAAWVEWESAQAEGTDQVLGWATFERIRSGETIERPEIRLALRRVIEYVETFVSFEGLERRQRNGPMQWVRIKLKSPLPDGVDVLTAAVHDPRFKGPRHVHFGEGVPDPPAYRAGVKQPGRFGGKNI